MHFVSQSLTFSDNTFNLLRRLIQERVGITFIPDNRELLADKLYPRVIECGLNSYLDYYYLLKYDAAATEWNKLMDAITVQETFFWRQVDQMKALVEVIIPQHFRERPTQPFRIWSAACASGEEPLTIAMLLQETGWLYHDLIEIHATDISPKAIAKAQAGCYRERAFRNLPLHLRQKYFQAEEGHWRVDPLLAQRIHWGIANLTDPQAVAPLAIASAIFCRNVFLYFSPEAIRQTVQLFYKAMPSPGYLFLSASESLLQLTTSFDLQEIGGAFVYVKS